MTKIYLAGPMRGYKEFNFPTFMKVSAKLRKMGYEVYNPAERDIKEDGFNPKKDKAKTLKHYMYYDLPAVCASDIVVVLDGWEYSEGARLEVHVARECGISVFSVDTVLKSKIKL